MVSRGVTYFAILFTGLLLLQAITPVYPGAKFDPSKVKPTHLDLSEAIDEGIGESPNPSPLPESPNVGPPRANFNGLVSWTFNSSNYVLDESLTNTDTNMNT